ncbi:peptidoglycan DD-metalloendopeptidase family protein [Streptomyces microflavus]
MKALGKGAVVLGTAVPAVFMGIVLAGAGASDASGGPALTLAHGLNTALMPKAGHAWTSWYTKSAKQCPGGKLTPALLAAQGYQESGFNPTIEGPPTDYGTAKGIAQFIDSTWATYAQDADGDGTALGAKDPEDAIMAQGRYMCKLVKDADKSGYNGDSVSLALAGYNAGWGWVQHYRAVPPESFAAGQTYHYVRIITANAKKWGSTAGAPLSTQGWTKPVDGPVGTPYRAAGANWASGYHTGVDFVVPLGRTVRAAGPGEVVKAGSGGYYGNEVVVRHDDGMYSQYAHLSSISVSKGQKVEGGQAMGLSGATGNVTGPHLHFEIRTGPAYGSDISPVSYLRQRGVSL